MKARAVLPIETDDARIEREYADIARRRGAYLSRPKADFIDEWITKTEGRMPRGRSFTQ